MRHIGFHNFRRFKDLDRINFAPITILVGGNNSGKSTLVKGLLLLNSFLDHDLEVEDVAKQKSTENGFASDQIDERRFRDYGKKFSRNQRFYFNENYYAHIGTIQRALNNESKEKEITFRFGLDRKSWDYEVTVEQDVNSENATSGRVIKIRETNRIYNVELLYDLKEWTARLIFHPKDPATFQNPGAEEWLNQIEAFYGSFSEDVEFDISFLDKLSVPFERNIIPSLNEALSNVLTHAIITKEEAELVKNERPPFRRESVPPDKCLPKFSDEQISFLRRSPGWNKKSCEFSIGGAVFGFQENVEYVYAHAVTQTVIYGTNNNDYVVNTIRNFADLKINKETAESSSKKERIYKFITDWMDQFEIGTDYEIQSFGGEAYLVKITNADGKVVNLADMGMGSIQLMILLFRLGILMHEMKYGLYTIILEEPEQNLHPKLQSKLTGLLLDTCNTFRRKGSSEYTVRFIVETHSEYLIRNSQVIVGKQFNTEEKLKNNPFKVYYFPSDDTPPYDMEYTPSGRFNRLFGKGFFDEAATLHMTVLKNSKK